MSHGNRRVSEDLSRQGGPLVVAQLLGQGYSWNGQQANTLFRNRGNGVFDEIGLVVGAGSRRDGRTFAVFDFDRDGDLDLCVRNRPGPAALQFLENVFASDNGWVSIRLHGKAPNRDAVGSRVRIVAEGRTQVQQLTAGSGLMSQQGKILHFGLGGAQLVREVEVRWPTGRVESFGPVQANSFLHLKEDNRHDKDPPDQIEETHVPR